MIYDILADLINLIVFLIKNLPKSLDFLKPYATLLGVIVLLMRQNNIKKMVNSHLPKKFRDTQSNDIYDMKRDIKAIKQHLGVVECGDTKTSSNMEAKSLKRLRTIFSKVTLLRKLLLRRKKKMSKWKSRKFLITLVSAGLLIAKEGLGYEVDSETILAFAGIVVTWIIGESHIDAKKVGGKNAELDIPIEPTL